MSREVGITQLLSPEIRNVIDACEHEMVWMGFSRDESPFAHCSYHKVLYKHHPLHQLHIG